MKAMKILSAVGAVALFANGAAADLLISEVVDATLSGGNPKFVEIYNSGPGDFTFADGGVVVQSNAAIDYNVDVDLTGVTIAAGECYVIQSSSNGGQAIFESTYGFAADLYTPAFFSNGDDRYILTTTSAGDGTGLLDIHGDDGVDGTGTAWEYLDSYAYRLPGSSANGGVFAIGEWFHAGVDALETGDDVTELALIQALTTPGECLVPEPSTLALLGFGVLGLIRRRR